jgi:hypothetical protein
MEISRNQEPETPLDHEFVQVSKNGIIFFILFIFVMTAILMSVFMFVDFESLLGIENLAMKVGQTSINFENLSRIKKISGSEAIIMSDQAFASDLFENLLLAQDARNRKLDNEPALKRKYQAFQDSINLQKDERRLAVSAYEIEELAQASIARMIKNNKEYQQKLISKAPTPDGMPETKLHLRVITAKNASDAAKIEKEIASGTTFTEINKKYSNSLYKSVQGDIGIKTRNDFPEGVFDLFLTARPGKLIKAYEDNSGIHFYEVIARFEPDIEKQSQALKEKQIQALKKRLIANHLRKLEKEIDYWINPVLRGACRISTTSGQTLKE